MRIFRIRFPVRDSYRVYIRDPKGIRFVWDGISRSAGDELEVFARSQFPLESVSIVVECEDRDALPEVFEVEEAMAGPGGRG